jgi:hypothetical protein
MFVLLFKDLRCSWLFLRDDFASVRSRDYVCREECKGEHGTPREYVEMDMDLVHWCLFSMREKTE